MKRKIIALELRNIEMNASSSASTGSAFNKTRLPPELRRVLSCKSPAVFLHFLLEKKGPWGPFYQLRRVLAKGRHLLQILLKALTGQLAKPKLITHLLTYATAFSSRNFHVTQRESLEIQTCFITMRRTLLS